MRGGATENSTFILPFPSLPAWISIQINQNGGFTFSPASRLQPTVSPVKIRAPTGREHFCRLYAPPLVTALSINVCRVSAGTSAKVSRRSFHCAIGLDKHLPFFEATD